MPCGEIDPHLLSYDYGGDETDDRADDMGNQFDTPETVGNLILFFDGTVKPACPDIKDPTA